MIVFRTVKIVAEVEEDHVSSIGRLAEKHRQTRQTRVRAANEEDTGELRSTTLIPLLLQNREVSANWPRSQPPSPFQQLIRMIIRVDKRYKEYYVTIQIYNETRESPKVVRAPYVTQYSFIVKPPTRFTTQTTQPSGVSSRSVVQSDGTTFFQCGHLQTHVKCFEMNFCWN